LRQEFSWSDFDVISNPKIQRGIGQQQHTAFCQVILCVGWRP
jgi:hypothetical protein